MSLRDELTAEVARPRELFVKRERSTPYAALGFVNCHLDAVLGETLCSDETREACANHGD